MKPFDAAWVQTNSAALGVTVKTVVCESTMTFAKENPVITDTAYVASEQASGRGRGEKPFLSLAGGLYVSLVLWERAEPKTALKYPLLVGLAVSDALMQFGMDAKVKWPNDVVVNGKKIAGCLVENHVAKTNVVLGVGININNDVSELKEIATSAQTEGFALTREEVLLAFLQAFYNQKDLPIAEMITRYLPRCKTIGETVYLRESGIFGRAVGLDEDGFLLVEMADKTIKRIINPLVGV